ncbi:hypothetical protein [Actinoplanes sp. NPDC023714]|uniref:hypothetical protein n=1 Tax=Actinoplanes sp. NPDC023714 TaxID=3154322 RepID=UPI0033E4A121
MPFEPQDIPHPLRVTAELVATSRDLCRMAAESVAAATESRTRSRALIRPAVPRHPQRPG